MDCETLHLELPDLIYGELDAERRTACESHTASCADCASLLGELNAVRDAQGTYVPSPLLTSRIKLAARDALLAGNEPPSTFAPGGSAQIAGTALLAACIGLVAFALGIAYERAKPVEVAPAPHSLPVPTNAADLVRQAPQPEWLVEINQEDEQPIQVPRAQTAWQRVLHDAANSRLLRGEHAEAREFFLNAAEVAPDGPLAAACRVGAAEAVLRAGDRGRARDELREVRKQVLAGLLPGGPPLLQRITELLDEATEVAPGAPPSGD